MRAPLAKTIVVVMLASAAPITLAGAALATGQVVMPSGVKYTDTVVGKGAEARPGQSVDVQYTGWIDQNGRKGAKFDSSRDRGKPFTFTLGTGQVIAGWDEGVARMKVGGKRTLVIPPPLAYGEKGSGTIPSGATLIFDIELVGVH
jgi:peptidylprolyl isomerase